MERGFFEIAMKSVNIPEILTLFETKIGAVHSFEKVFKNTKIKEYYYLDIDNVSKDIFEKYNVNCCGFNFELAIDEQPYYIECIMQVSGWQSYMNLNVSTFALDWDGKSLVNQVAIDYFKSLPNDQKRMLITSDNGDYFSISIDEALCTSGFKKYYISYSEDPISTLTTMIVHKDDYHLFEHDLLLEEIPVKYIDDEFIEVNIGKTRYSTKLKAYYKEIERQEKAQKTEK